LREKCTTRIYGSLATDQRQKIPVGVQLLGVGRLVQDGKTVAAMKTKPEIYRRDCSPEDLRAIKAIVGITFVPGIPTKRFAAQIQGETQLTEKQRIYLWSIIWTFRRQIADKDLVEIAEKWRCANERCQ
jgi:hypothetical protein